MVSIANFQVEQSSIVTAIIGLGGVIALLYYKYRGGGKPYRLVSRHRRSPVLRDVIASERPAIATANAVKHIASGDIATLSELLYFFRGKDEKMILLHPSLYAYLQRFFAQAAAVESIPPQFENKQAHRMLRMLCHCTGQAARLERERAASFDESNPEHMQLLKDLWIAAGKPPESFSRSNKEWNDLGFQGLDPSTDFRGGGVLALRQFLHFAQTHNAEFRAMMEFNKKTLNAGEHSWYLTAVVSIQFTAQLLLQQDHKFHLPQLEILYDTVWKDGKNGGEPCSAAVERRGCCGSRGEDSHDVWDHESDFEAGFNVLHHQLLLHFKKCWHRDLPHVMEYNNYMLGVFRSFFTSG